MTKRHCEALLRNSPTSLLTELKLPPNPALLENGKAEKGEIKALAPLPENDGKVSFSTDEEIAPAGKPSKAHHCCSFELREFRMAEATVLPLSTCVKEGRAGMARRIIASDRLQAQVGDRALA